MIRAGECAVSIDRAHTLCRDRTLTPRPEYSRDANQP